MSVDFLTADQRRHFGRFAGEPTAEQLARYFHLDETDRQHTRSRHGDHNTLGFALQLGTVRFLGTFLSQRNEVPPGVIAYLAHQLEIKDPSCLQRYQDQVRWRHVHEISKLHGYREFHDQPGHWQLIRWLYVRAWLGAERPSVLFDHAAAWLVERKILLPGITTLARLVGRIRDRALARLWQVLNSATSAEQRARLEALLTVTAEKRQSDFDRLRRAPTRVSGRGFVEALERLEEVRALGVGKLELSRVSPGRLDALARYAHAAKAQAISRMPEDRRLATLLAFARELEVRATDDALDLFEVFVKDLLSQSESEGKRQRLRTIKDLDEAAVRLAEGWQTAIEGNFSSLEELWRTVSERVSTEQLAAAARTVLALARPHGDYNYDDLLRRYRTARLVLFELKETFELQANEAGRPVVEALEALAAIEHRPPVRDDEVPLEIVPPAWRRLVQSAPGELDRRAYTLCVLEQLREALKRHDVFVMKSKHWTDTSAQLLKGSAWKAARPHVCRMLRISPKAEEELSLLRLELDETYRQTAAHFPKNEAIRVESRDGRDALVLTPLEALDEPQSLLELREDVAALLPQVDLPEVLLEVDAWTGFTREFTHVSEGSSRVQDLAISVSAVLIAQACNLGLAPLVRADLPALTRGRLSWIDQAYFRGETIRAANACLVDHQATIPLAQQWGGGEVASVDGIRFVVPVRTINAGPNPHYYGPKRGVTLLNVATDQFTGFNGPVVPGTLRDSIYILAALLQNETKLRPVQIMTDTASYSDLVCGLFRLLGYRFCPRLADLGGARLWRIDRTADYGPLNSVSRHRIDTDRIATHWDDILRVAGSLVSGTVPPDELIRSLQGGGKPTTLGRAIAEYGRIPKTIHLLNFIEDEAYRRQILVQLNRHESRHSLARLTFHGKKGELRQPYREGQEDQLGALGLVVNAIVFWNTRYIALALDRLRTQGKIVRDEDVERLSPLGHEHINLHGRYYFGLPEEIQRGDLRPLRDPEKQDL